MAPRNFLVVSFKSEQRGEQFDIWDEVLVPYFSIKKIQNSEAIVKKI